MAKSKFFRVGVEGATVDGRVIQRDWLEQMAANYDPATYTARINCEHIAGYSPEKPFNAYGSVLSLKVEEVELTIAGEKKTLLALYAEIDANDQLVAINKADQKLFTSMEIHPDFAGEGQAYLVGLAVTDSPASLGTEALKFAAQSRSNVFSTAHETAIELESDARTVVDAIKAGFAGLAGMFKAESPKKEEPKTPPAPANDNNFDFAKFSDGMGNIIAAAVKPALDAANAANSAVADLKTQLEKAEKPGTFKRAPASGGQNAIVTDC